MWPHGTAIHRLAALRRLGHEVDTFDSDQAWSGGGRLSRWVRFRTLSGPRVSRANARLAEMATGGGYDMAWLDKPIFVAADTVRRLTDAGVLTVEYNPDNPFGPRRDPGWRLLLEAIPEYGVHLVPRRVNLSDYRRAGARRVLELPFAYEPTVHLPPPAGWSERDRDVDVAFIGSPYDDRPAFIEALWRRHGIRVSVRGAGWERRFGRRSRGRVRAGEPVYSDAYREAIWRSRIVLAFVTRANADDTAHRCFEIAACAGFMLAARTEGNLACFAEDGEAAYFSDFDECAEKIRHYLADPGARAAIGAAARARAVRSGYGNDARLERALQRIADGEGGER